MITSRIRFWAVLAATLAVVLVSAGRLDVRTAAADFTPPTDKNWVAIDCDLVAGGIQNSCAVPLGQQLEVGVVVGNVIGAPAPGSWEPAAFNFDVTNTNKAALTPPAIACGGASYDCNPDFNQGALTGAWDCSFPTPNADHNGDGNPNTSQSRLSCFNPSLDGPSIPQDGSMLFAKVRFDAPGQGTAVLALDRVYIGNEINTLARCDTVATQGVCAGASITVVNAALDTDGDGCRDIRELGPSAGTGGLRNPSNQWDFFDVSTPKDERVNGIDVALVKSKVGTISGDANYSANMDRVAGAQPWAPGPPNGQINGIDVALVKASVGHSCVAPP